MSIITMRKAFNEFIDENGQNLGDTLNEMWSIYRDIPDDQFIYGISFIFFGYWHKKGSEGLEFIVNEITKEKENKSFAEVCPDAEIREKFLLFIEFFCEKIGERPDVREALDKMDHQ